MFVLSCDKVLDYGATSGIVPVTDANFKSAYYLWMSRFFIIAVIFPSTFRRPTTAEKKHPRASIKSHAPEAGHATVAAGHEVVAAGRGVIVVDHGAITASRDTAVAGRGAVAASHMAVIVAIRNVVVVSSVRVCHRCAVTHSKVSTGLSAFIIHHLSTCLVLHAVFDSD